MLYARANLHTDPPFLEMSQLGALKSLLIIKEIESVRESDDSAQNLR